MLSNISYACGVLKEMVFFFGRNHFCIVTNVVNVPFSVDNGPVVSHFFPSYIFREIFSFLHNVKISFFNFLMVLFFFLKSVCNLVYISWLSWLQLDYYVYISLMLW